MTQTAVGYRPLHADDFPAAEALWLATPGMGLDPVMDTAPAIAAYLQKNPGFSFAACTKAAGTPARLIGTILAGTDGRRGYLMHLAVEASFRRQGIARKLVELSLAGLRAVGITKAHVFVFQNNTEGAAFWRALGWTGRDDLLMLSTNLPPQQNCDNRTAISCC